MKIIFLLIIYLSALSITGQNEHIVNIKVQNNNVVSSLPIDSLSINLLYRYSKFVQLDTLYWSIYPQLDIDSIIKLQGKSANDLAKLVLNIKQSIYYSKQAFNLVGSYSENEMRNDTISTEQIKTKVLVYDHGFNSNQPILTHTENCDFVHKSPNISPTVYDTWTKSLGGEYSNLYYSLDLDFLRMYNCPYSKELGVDRRIWSKRDEKSELHVPDDFKYFKAYKKDSSNYLILVSSRTYSMIDQKRKNPKVTINVSKENEDISNIFKYLLINLNTNSIEKTGHFTISTINSIPISITSYETSYKLVGNQYFLNHVSNNTLRFLPKINHIDLRCISFNVEKVINEPLKVIKIKESKADPRNVNYIDQFINNNLKINEKE